MSSDPQQLALFRGRDRWVRRLEVPSTTVPGRTYTLACDAAGSWACSCPAWVYQAAPAADREPCKHLRGRG